MSKKKAELLLGLAFGAFVTPTGLHAQLAQEENQTGGPDGDQPGIDDSLAAPVATGSNVIVVTATKTGERAIQDIPIAITAFDAESLNQRGAVNVEAVAALTPNVTFGSNLGGAIVTVRGIGTNNIFAGGDPSVSIQVDGVYYARPTGANLDFFDIERIEVLRGPQGTLYGRNATGGTINVITREPGNSLEFAAQATVGNYELYRGEFFLGVPISDAVGFSISGRHSERNGFIETIVPGVPDLGSEDRQTLRGRLRIDPSPDVSLILSADYTHADDQISNYTVRRFIPPFLDDGNRPDFFEASVDFDSPFYLEQWGVSGTLNWDLGPDISLTSITAYRDSESDARSDTDNTAFPLLATTLGLEQQDQFSQEINLSGRTGNLEWVIGGFYFEEEASVIFNGVSQLPPFPGALGFLTTVGVDVSTRSYAGFAQGTYELTDRLSLTAGIRYTQDEKDGFNIAGFQPLFTPAEITAALSPQAVAAGTGNTPSTANDSDAWTPKFGLDFSLTEDVMLYASVTRGFKAGGYNAVIQPGDPTVPYRPETLWAYEAGIKSTLLDGRLTANLTAFLYDYQDLQVNQVLTIGNNVQTLISNAPEAEVYGAELELAFRATDRLEFGGNLSLLDTEYTGSFLVPDATTNINVDARGNELNDAPNVSGLVYAQLSVPLSDRLNLIMRGDAQHKGSVFYSPANNLLESQDSYWLVNASVVFELDDGRWQFGVRGRNLFDEEYLTNTAVAFGVISGRPGDPFTVSGFLRYEY